MPTLPRITGTFLDEITHDIPSQNWGYADWKKEFELYSKIGIDSVVIIRAGYQNKCIFPSKTIPNLLPIYDDLGETFYSLADEYNLDVYFGTYDSGFHWWRRNWWKEVELNLPFLEEAVQRYGHHKSFKGWYLTHETSKNDAHIIELFNHIGRHCKELKDVPVLISPYPQGAKQFGENVMSLDESFEHWDRIFGATKGAFDICAFQDGQIHYQELPRFIQGIGSLGSKHGVTIWSNLETFDRDMPIKFPPADWRYLRFKMEAATPVAEKIITFEFPHFMSPHSCYPAAHNLFERYREFAGIELK
ncbi:MAG: Tat pathway signal protein [Armatimonadetes bacterium 55-13]|nr:DUF4434 domain-containing protein [Armatimonadota bacterium]OJU62643.1 MAG: Tat pathway signal protein [Armatimonadetes bacterium 55-13]